MTTDTDRVLMELWPNWIPTSEEQSLWSDSLGRFSLRVATRALRTHRTQSQYPTPTLSLVLSIARGIVEAEHEATAPASRSAEHARFAERCRQDDDGHRRLVDSLPMDVIADTVERVRTKMRIVAPPEWWTKPTAQWSKYECGFFAAQYDLDLKDSTVKLLTGAVA